MNERNVLIAGGLVGALAGVAAAYLFFTENGQRWREHARANLSVFVEEAERLLSAANQVRQSVADLGGGSQGKWPRSA